LRPSRFVSSREHREGASPPSPAFPKREHHKGAPLPEHAAGPRPLVRILDQTGADWIRPDVFNDFCQALCRAYAVIEEAALPQFRNTFLRSQKLRELLEKLYPFDHRNQARGNQHVQMRRHQAIDFHRASLFFGQQPELRHHGIVEILSQVEPLTQECIYRYVEDVGWVCVCLRRQPDVLSSGKLIYSLIVWSHGPGRHKGAPLPDTYLLGTAFTVLPFASMFREHRKGAPLPPRPEHKSGGAGQDHAVDILKTRGAQPGCVFRLAVAAAGFGPHQHIE
jgi:hypothetical protein